MTAVRLACGGAVVEVDEAVGRLATRLALEQFPAGAGPAALKVVRVARLPPEAEPFDGNLGPGRFRVEGDELQVQLQEDALGAEAALRLAWDVLTEREGGVLLHASGVAVAGTALVVTGPSGAGKTTIARHAAAAGATLLSDEIVQLLPGGRCVGTPFRSDLRLAGGPHRARLGALATVVHAAAERLEPWSPGEALALARGQVFRRPGAPVAGLTRRLLAALREARCLRLHCRDHPQAGRFVVEWLADGH